MVFIHVCKLLGLRSIARGNSDIGIRDRDGVVVKCIIEFRLGLSRRGRLLSWIEGMGVESLDVTIMEEAKAMGEAASICKGGSFFEWAKE